MKKSVVYISSFVMILLLFVSCSQKKEKLPPLTYTGEHPRIQNPLSPDDSRKHIQLPEGFRAELFASEPNIINPIAFTWDEKGRLWVVQSHDYPHGLANDVGGDRITICEDTDGDGKADKFTDFATKQSMTTAITLVKGGAIVAQAPEMVFLQDTDGDDKMDKSTVLFDGYGTFDTHAGPSNLRYGLDNKIWGAVGYSGFEGQFQGKQVEFKMGVYKFAKDGSTFEPVGQFNNNTWGVGFNENFEIFGSTANNNHCCYVGIPLRNYDYLSKLPKWALNADFIQGHYEITPADTIIPLQQVDVRGGFTAASGANFYTARNYPEKYQNQMYVSAPTGHLVHIAKIVKDGAGYKEVDGGNIFASTDAWTAPVFTETGPDGNLWVADWYNPVIQHNPDRRGMENQVWNTVKGEGNAHINKLRDYSHGRIYIIKYDESEDADITSLDPKNDSDLLQGLQSDNMFWRTTAQRLIVENNKNNLIPELVKLVDNDGAIDKTGLNAPALHALWTLDGLGAFGKYPEADAALIKALSNKSYAVKRAAIALLPNTIEASEKLAESGLLHSSDPQIKLAALLKAGELPESGKLYSEVDKLSKDKTITSDKWLNAAIKIYFREANLQEVDPSTVEMLVPAADERKSVWKYTTTDPGNNWNMADFNDSSWQKGEGPFGGKDAPNANTLWTTPDIWMRKEVVLKKELTQPVIKIIFDDDYEVYINGELLASEAGANETYKYVKIDEEKSGFFKKGKNSIAVHCKNTGGLQHIDMGLGEIGKIKADVVFTVNTVPHKMAFDKTVLNAVAGQTIEIKLNNKDEMPHNLVVIQPESLETFGGLVDAFLKNPDAEKMDYVPNSRNVLGNTEMLAPGENESIFIKLPNEPGDYPFVCTFPGHWRMMQGKIIVTAPKS